MGRQRRLARLIHRHVVGRHDGQLLDRYRHDAATIAVDNGDGTAPETLARNEPVAKSEINLRFAGRILDDELNGGLLGGVHIEAIKEARVDLHARTGVGATSKVFRRSHGAHDGQPVNLSEGEVALVFGRYGHDGTRAVRAEDIVRNVDRHLVTSKGVDDVTAGEGASLIEARAAIGRSRALKFAGATGPLHKFVHGGGLLGSRESGEKFVLGGDHGVGHTKAGVGSSRKDSQRHVGLPIDRKGEFGPIAAANPVALHRLNTLGPFQVIDFIQELIGVVSDLEEPLFEILSFDQVAGTVAGSIPIDLLVSEDRGASGTPVHRGVRPIGQAGFEEL